MFSVSKGELIGLSIVILLTAHVHTRRGDLLNPILIINIKKRIMKAFEFLESKGLGSCASQSIYKGKNEALLSELMEAYAATRMEDFNLVLKRYESWEAKLILNDTCWGGGVPIMTSDLHEEFLEIQELRNLALEKVKS